MKDRIKSMMSHGITGLERVKEVKQSLLGHHQSPNYYELVNELPSTY
jgi:hypothetical protein